jgi:hypothetical protein
MLANPEMVAQVPDGQRARRDRYKRPTAGHFPALMK